MRKKIKEYTDPFPECEKCKTLADCPSPDVIADGMGSAVPPECCIRYYAVMKETYKTKRRDG